MDHAGGYEEYAVTADLYDHVVPYRDRSAYISHLNN